MYFCGKKKKKVYLIFELFFVNFLSFVKSYGLLNHTPEKPFVKSACILGNVNGLKGFIELHCHKIPTV